MSHPGKNEERRLKKHLAAVAEYRETKMFLLRSSEAEQKHALHRRRQSGAHVFSRYRFFIPLYLPPEDRRCSFRAAQNRMIMHGRPCIRMTVFFARAIFRHCLMISADNSRSMRFRKKRRCMPAASSRTDIAEKLCHKAEQRSIGTLIQNFHEYYPYDTKTAYR